MIISLVYNVIGKTNTTDLIIEIALLLVAVVVGLGMVWFVVHMHSAERRIPVQYAKRQVGRKMYGGQSTYLPLKVNMTGVMPLIFASSIVALPTTIAMMAGKSSATTGFWGFMNTHFSPSSWVYAALTFVLIIAFAYFYISISFSPIEVANNLKKNGGSIMGIRPGKPTTDYITKILTRITLIGAIFLALIAVIPLIASRFASSFNLLAFGGSSIIIVVGVVIETVTEIETQMTMRHYKGFLE
jgi:preprotein translocase subunit SecY